MLKVTVPFVALSIAIVAACASVPRQEVPSPPTVPSQTVAASGHRAVLSWSGPKRRKSASNVERYNIYRAPASLDQRKVTCTEQWVKIASTIAPVTRFTDENVTAGSAYCYAVTSVNSRAESPKSTLVKAIIPSP